MLCGGGAPSVRPTLRTARRRAKESARARLCASHSREPVPMVGAARPLWRRRRRRRGTSMSHTWTVMHRATTSRIWLRRRRPPSSRHAHLAFVVVIVVIFVWSMRGWGQEARSPKGESPRIRPQPFSQGSDLDEHRRRRHHLTPDPSSEFRATPSGLRAHLSYPRLARPQGVAQWKLCRMSLHRVAATGRPDVRTTGTPSERGRGRVGFGKHFFFGFGGR